MQLAHEKGLGLWTICDKTEGLIKKRIPVSIGRIRAYAPVTVLIRSDGPGENERIECVNRLRRSDPARRGV